MFGANVTMRSLKNTNTGIDITVPTIQEIEAPLGGTSTEYEISVLTTLDLYKSHLHSKEDVIHFSVFKAYKEVEGFHDKVVKKFSDVGIPSLPKGRTFSKCSVEEKRSSLDRFMQEVSHHKNICDSSVFLQFFGINKHRKSRSSISETFSEVSLHDSGVSSPGSADQNSQLSNQIEENPSLYDCTAKLDAVDASNKKDEVENDDQMISELFPKMKVRKSSKVDVVDEVDDVKEEFHPSLQAEISQAENMLINDDLDLFEEVEKTKNEEKKVSKRSDSNRLSHQGLFDSFDDSSSLLFSPSNEQSSPDKPLFDSSEVVSNTTNNKGSSAAMKENASDGETTDLFRFESNASPLKPVIPKQETACDPFVMDRLFQDEAEMDTLKRIPGTVSLFEEQDFGTSISQDDEALFFVPKADKATVVNSLLSPASDDVSDDGVTETLEELITLPEPSAELPKPELMPADKEVQKLPPEPESTPAVKEVQKLPPKSESAPAVKEVQKLPPKPESTPAVKEVQKLPPKPVPKPRNKPNVLSEAKEKPQVLPRKGFPAKPTLPPKPMKPMVPPKPSSTTAQKQQPEGTSVIITENKKNDAVENLSNLDILQYIEQEEKIASAQAGLFD